MTYRGRIKNGVVVLDRRAKLAEGTRVRVEEISPTKSINKAKPNSALGKRLMRFAGAVHGLPRDLAQNHDHYIHGARRK